MFVSKMKSLALTNSTFKQVEYAVGYQTKWVWLRRWKGTRSIELLTSGSSDLLFSYSVLLVTTW